MFPSQAEIDGVIAVLHGSPWKVVMACTGAGTGLQSMLWDVPGSSRTLLESVIPYAKESLAAFIGHEPKKCCSRETAFWMAAASYRRARSLAFRGGTPDVPVMGLGLTATVITNREKKGEQRAFVAVQTDAGMTSFAFTIPRGSFGRVDQGRICDLVALNTILDAAGITQVPLRDYGLGIHSENVVLDRARGDDGYVVRPNVAPPLDDVPVGRSLLCMPDGSFCAADALHPETHLLFPGSFDPLHEGHVGMALQAERATGKQAVFAITGTHPDKGESSDGDLLRRAEQFRWFRPVLLTRGDALYVDKAKAFKGFGFLIGADAASGLLDPERYGSPRKRDVMLGELDDLKVRFAVTGRLVGETFVTLDAIAVPEPWRHLFVPVPGRWDVRSRDFR